MVFGRFSALDPVMLIAGRPTLHFQSIVHPIHTSDPRGELTDEALFLNCVHRSMKGHSTIHREDVYLIGLDGHAVDAKKFIADARSCLHVSMDASLIDEPAHDVAQISGISAIRRFGPDGVKTPSGEKLLANPGGCLHAILDPVSVARFARAKVRLLAIIVIDLDYVIGLRELRPIR